MGQKYIHEYLKFVSSVTESTETDYDCNHRTELKPYPCAKPLEYYFCSKCNLGSNTVVRLKRHLMRGHSLEENSKWMDPLNKKSIYKCTRCLFKTFSILLWHKHAIDGCRTFKCVQCSWETRYDTNMYRHQVLEHTGDENRKWFQCDQCAYKTLLQDRLNSHCKLKHGGSAKRVRTWLKCGQCMFVTKTKIGLKNHIMAKHTDDKDKIWVECDMCAFKTVYKRSLKRHLTAHSGSKN